MQSLLVDISIISSTDAAVIIEGETGVGKSLVAQVIHEESVRSQGPFVAFSAANLSEDLFESEFFGHVKGAFSGAHDHHVGLARSAHTGTLFIDEIAELSAANQAKLLRFLDDQIARPVGGIRGHFVDTRVICATNEDLDRSVQEASFRRDLYYRLKVFSLEVPPLRERQGDIPLLVDHFFHRYCSKYDKDLKGIAGAVRKLLNHYPWEGNVRELEHEIERMVAMTPDGEEVSTAKVSRRIRHAAVLEAANDDTVLDEARKRAERKVLIKAIERHGWNVSATARELGMSRVGLSRKLSRLDIQRPGRRQAE